jgi:hypothetical protein
VVVSIFTAPHDGCPDTFAYPETAEAGMIVKRLCRGVLLVTLTAAAWDASAQDTSPLRGELFITGKTPIDPPPGEPKNSHAYLTISGSAALRMYRAMRAKEEPNECETGKKLKRAGSLSCSVTRDGKAATCDFSVDLIKGALDDGRPC